MPASPRNLEYIDIAGVVPCAGGWLVLPGRLAGITVSADEPFVVREFRDVLEYRPSFAFAAYAIPFGYPDESDSPYRRCDDLACELLGWPRSASVAPVPSLTTLSATSFEAARESAPWLRPRDNRRLARYREVATTLQAYHTRTNYSALPELSFAQMNLDRPMTSSPWSAEGQAQRLGLVRSMMRGVDNVISRTPPEGADVKQVFDAAAMLWTARRASGRAVTRMPQDPEWNRRGIRLEWVR